mmetsp:Transcript_24869/g.36682  ORF Transcript_24869/g.36682 Transcript_24869/m.36682 type:complete len:433 (+) Transcript_24869:104-1402(+)
MSQLLQKSSSRDHAGIVSILTGRDRDTTTTQPAVSSTPPRITEYESPGSTDSEVSRPRSRPVSRSHSKTDFCYLETEVIRCISANIVSLIKQSEQDHYIPPYEYRIFSRECTTDAIHPDSFSLEAVQFIFTIIHRESEMEYECMIIALIYMERLSRVTNKAFRVCALNWRYTLFTCMLLASKIWDDFSMVNADFADIFSNTSLSHLNKMESEVLTMLNFSMMITDEEYMKLHSTIQELIYMSKCKQSQDRFELYGFEEVLHAKSNSDCSACRDVDLDDWSDDSRESIPLRTGGVQSPLQLCTVRASPIRIESRHHSIDETSRLRRSTSDEVAWNCMRRKPVSSSPVLSSQQQRDLRHTATPYKTERKRNNTFRRLGKAVSSLAKCILPSAHRRSNKSTTEGKVYVDITERLESTTSSTWHFNPTKQPSPSLS